MNDLTPNLFIVGTAKAGTTSLHSYLSQHPEIFMSTPKEPNFFGSDPEILYQTILSKDIKQSKCQSFENYLGLFQDSKKYKVRGESSVATMYLPNAIKEISEKIKDFKIIVILRNPIDRAYSNYMHHVRDGMEDLSFEMAIEAQEDRKNKNYTWGYQYLNIGLYSEQIIRLYHHVPKERIRIYLFEDFNLDTELVLKDICKFLDVEETFKFSIKQKLNKSGVLSPNSYKTYFIKKIFRPNSIFKIFLKKILTERLRRELGHKMNAFFVQKNLKRIPLDQTIKKMLLDFYYADIKKTEKLINKDLSHWYK